MAPRRAGHEHADNRENEIAYSLIWRFDAEGSRTRLDWRISVDADAAGSTFLTVRLCGRGTGETGKARTLASWTLLEELARGHAQRLGRTIGEYAGADDYDGAAAQLRAAI